VLAGEGEEHLVEARLAERELADAHARPAKSGHRCGRLLTGRAPGAGGRDSGGQQDRIGSLVDRRTQEPGERPPGQRPLRRFGQPDPQGAGASRGFELAGCPFGDHGPVVDDRDPGGELVGLVQVLGGSSTVAPSAASARMTWCTWARLAGAKRGFAATSCPATRARPPSGASRVARIRAVVVLPAP
jgi:hypothetical protein